jgi:hypothetical protein
MLPSSVTALAIVLIAILPGAVYTWAFEREAGAYGVTFADRTLRFLAASVILHLLLAWPEYVLYRLALRGHGEVLAGQFAALWAGFLLLAAIPAVAGTIIGGLYATRDTRQGWSRVRSRLSEEREKKLLRIIAGRDPAPRAWDDLFSGRPSCYLRVRTTSEQWLAGRFAADSYAGGYPNEQDVLLEEAYEMDDETGELGDPVGYRVYIPASQIAWIEVIPQEA